MWVVNRTLLAAIERNVQEAGMPSFRDLKGQPVDDLVDSRDIPHAPDPGVVLAEREAVRQAVEKITAAKARLEPLDIVEDRADPEAAEARERVEAALNSRPPGTFDEALAELQEAITAMGQACERVRFCATRARMAGVKDRQRLEKLNELLKVLD